MKKDQEIRNLPDDIRVKVEAELRNAAIRWNCLRQWQTVEKLQDCSLSAGERVKLELELRNLRIERERI